MSRSRKPRIRGAGSRWERLRGAFFSDGRRGLRDHKFRRLRIDALEERTLLSVSPVNIDDVLINQFATTDQYALAAKSIATDNNGDFVVAWQRTDVVFDVNGDSTVDSNIYARYFTNAVQRITLPAETAGFRLQYNGNEIQKLTINAGAEPFILAPSPIIGTFDLDFGGLIANVSYDENAGLEANAAAIQTALRGTGAVALSDVVVSAIDARNFQINFGLASEGQAQPLLTITDPNFSGFTSGFLPAAEVTMVRTPGMTIVIPISANPALTAEQNMAQTAQNIEDIFAATTQYFEIAPMDVSEPQGSPTSMWAAQPSVSVAMRSATEFDVTFTGDMGLLQQPLLNVFDAFGDAIDGADVQIIKQSSDEFRVNDPEPDDPWTLRFDVYHQFNPQMAMDADGDFVITWQSEVPDSAIPGSVTDIFARRFSPAGWVDDPAQVAFVADMAHVVSGELVYGPDGYAETPIQGVRPLGNQFQVNTFTTGAQSRPSVGMDADGNFTIAWESKAQDLSFFNIVEAQRFDRDGNRLGGEFMVNNEDDTTVNFWPYVAMSPGGATAIAWTNTDDVDYVHGLPYEASVLCKVYDAQGATLLDQFYVEGGGHPTLAFDAGNNFVVSWSVIRDNDNSGDTSVGVYAKVYQLYDADGNVSGADGNVSGADSNVSGTVVRDTFRVNSTSFDVDTNTTWPFSQWVAGVVMDADGDLTAAYTGFGPDVSETGVDQRIESELVASIAYYGQRLTFVDVNRLGGWFSLQFGDSIFAEKTVDIFFDPVNPDNTAQSIEDALKDMPSGTDVFSFLYEPGGPGDPEYTFNFHVTFSGLPRTRGERPLITLQLPLAFNHPRVHTTFYATFTDRDPVSMAALPALRFQLETQYGLLRGESGGAMFSQFDTDPRLSEPHILASDVVANNHRDGSNASYLLILDQRATRGDVTLTVTPQGAPKKTATIKPVFLADNPNDPNDGGIDASATLGQITSALSSMNLGENWAYPLGDGVFSVRLLSADEIAQRAGTAWGLDAYGIVDPNKSVVYEIDFMGELHDWPINVLAGSSLKSPLNIPEVQYIIFDLIDPLVPAFGSFTFTIGDFESVPIAFHSDHLDRVVPDIEEQLLKAGYLNPTVTIVSDSILAVTFGGLDAGRNIPSIVIDSPPSGATVNVLEYIPGHQELIDPFPLTTAAAEIYGEAGTRHNASIAMTSSGDFTIVWNEDAPGSTNLYFRTFNESTDTAGPMVTDVLLSSGERLSENATVTQQTSYFAVTFDSEMMTTGSHSVTNPENWTLLLDGAPIIGGISHIYYGMSEGHTRLGTPASNKWEAVLVLDGALQDGHYELVATNALRDKAGNALGRTGYTPDGGIFTRKFMVSLPTGGETIVNSITAGNQFLAPPNSQAVASDADGDYVTVWTSDAASEAGIYATIHNVNWINTADGRQMAAGYPITTQILITDNLTASNPSVACDAGGNFVVTWSQKDAGDWNVWAQRYDAAGKSVGDAFPVNAVTEGVQRYSTVAMDADGDFTIAWQSLNQDGSGYGVYAVRYNAAGQTVSGTNEIDVLTFTVPADVTTPNWDFFLSWSGRWTETINFTGDVAVVATAVQTALEAIGAEVKVTLLNETQLSIEFVGSSGSKNQPPLWVYSFDFDASITAVTSVEGKAYSIGEENAEFRVNDTVANNQMFPTIAMNASGAFVISWTGYGQDEDAQYQSNVYAKQFVSNDVLQQGSSGSYSEFLVNQTIANDQKWSSVAIDDAGNFVVTWTSYGQDGGGDGPGAGVGGENGIYLRRYNSAGAPVGNTVVVGEQTIVPDVLANAFTAGDQQYSRVAMNAAGDFTVVWESFQDRPAISSGLADSPNSFGIYGRSYVRNGLVGDDFYGINGETGAEFRLNTTTDDDQRYPSISMDPIGDFVVVWSGNGQADDQGVFLQRSDRKSDTIAPKVLNVFNVNRSDVVITLDRVIDNADMLGEITQFVVTFSEDLSTEGGAAGANSITNLLSNWSFSGNGQISSVEFGENLVYLSGWTAAPSNMYEAIVTFDGDADAAGDQPLGSGTYSLTVKSAVRDKFGNALIGFTRDFNVVLPSGVETLVNSGTAGNQFLGLPNLPPNSQSVASDANGDYVVVWTSDAAGSAGVYATIHDVNWINTIAGRQMADGYPTTKQILITNDPTASNPSVARDAGGNFVVTWSQQDEGDDWNVWARRYDAAGKPVGSEFRVNVVTENIQRYSTVAMDADGDFTIAWQSLNQDGSGYGVYAVRYNPAGQTINGANEIDILSFVIPPAGATDLSWDFTLSWNGKTTDDINFTGDVDAVADAVQAALEAIGAEVSVAQLDAAQISIEFIGAAGNKDQPPITVQYNDLDPGEAIIAITAVDGVPYSVDGPNAEFRVNDAAENNQVFPSIAMNASGAFVISWTSYGQDGDAPYQSNVYARQFVSNDVIRQGASGGGLRAGQEFRVNQTIANDQKWSALAIDDAGNFVVTWTSYGQDDASGTNGIYVQRYDSDGQAGGGGGGVIVSEFLVNSFTDNDQQYSRVAMSANGDFTVVWESFQDRPLISGGVAGAPDSFGIYGQNYVRNSLAIWGYYYGYGPNGEIGEEFRLNTTTDGDQRYPSISMDPLGDFVVVWSGNGQAAGQVDDQGVFMLHSDKASDTIGPEVLNTFSVNDTGAAIAIDQVVDNAALSIPVTHFIVTFSEDLSTTGGATGSHSVTNPSNWFFAGNGKVSSVTFGLNQARESGLTTAPSHMYEAVVTFDGDTTVAGDQPLGNGAYTLTVRSTIQDKFGNALTSLTRKFNVVLLTGGETLVNSAAAGNQSTAPPNSRAVASDTDGDYVVVWTSDAAGSAGVYATLYDVNWINTADGRRMADGYPTATQILVTDELTASNPSVACDAAGNFVVTWSQQDAGDWNVWARRYDAAGNPLGDAFRVNVVAEDVQRYSTVAMDADGNFTIAWQSLNQDGSGYGVYAVRYNSAGQTVSGANEIDVLNFVVPAGTDDPNWDFTLEWNGKTTGEINFTGDVAAVASAVQTALTAIGTEVNVAQLSDTQVSIEFIDSSGNKDQPPITVQHGNLGPGAAITAVTAVDGQSYSIGGANAEFRVNDTTAYNQMFPSIAMNASGAFVVSWTGYGQDGDAQYQSNVYTKQFISNDAVRQGGSGAGAEFLVNLTTDEDQKWSSLAISDAGDFVVTWTSYGQEGTSGGENGVYVRRYNAAGQVVGNEVTVVIVEGEEEREETIVPEFLANSFTAGDQQYSQVTMNAAGDFTVVWESFQDRPAMSGGFPTAADSFGVYGRSYVRNSLVGQGLYGPNGEAPNGEAGAEFRLNTTIDGNQRYPSIAMDAVGDFVVVWSGNGQVPGQVDGQGVFMQRSDKTSDTVGPKVLNVFNVNRADTTVTLDQVDDDASLSGQVTQFVVVFSEDLSTAGGAIGSNSVTNPNNWSFAGNGRISSVTFGLNQANLSGLTDAPSNMYEAVVTFDGNTVVAGDQPLDSGIYSLTVKSAVRDKFGNALVGFTRDFNVVLLTGIETLVNSNTTGNQFLGLPNLPPNSQSVASDADGDYVAVWTSDAASSAGVYATVYKVNWVSTTTGRQMDAGYPTAKQILVANNPTASNPSVARDAGGNFVVTWSQQDDGDWNVWARRYDAAGNPLEAASMVNVVTENVQRYSTVAMDADGDFIIAWQSLNQDGSGYGVYAVRYNPTGQTISGENEVDVLSFVVPDGITPNWDFTLKWSGKTTESINFTDDVAAVADVVQTALEEIDAQVNVTQLSDTQLSIEFIGGFGNKDQPSITVQYDDLGPGAAITVVTAVEGEPYSIGGANAEFRVNDTTANNQMFPSIAVNSSGAFVVSWTSYGQEGDDRYHSNVYARQFVSNDVVQQGGPRTSREFQVNLTTADDQKWSAVAIDEAGNFVVTWTGSGQDGSSGENGVYARRYNSAGEAVGNEVTVVVVDGDDETEETIVPEFLVNSFTTGDQQYSRVAMDAAGNFTVVWESFQDQPQTSGGVIGAPDSFGVYGRSYVRNDLVGNELYGPNGEAGTEFRLNTTTDGDQRYPSISMDPVGDFVVVWSGNGQVPGQVDDQGVFVQRSDRVSDAIGPQALNTFTVNDTGAGITLKRIVDGDSILGEVTQFVVTFSENLSTSGGAAGANSITNPNNWTLMGNGRISSVEFGLSQAYLSGLTDPPTNVYEAVVTFDGDTAAAGNQPLGSGSYSLTVKKAVRDKFGNALTTFTRTFSVSGLAGPGTPPDGSIDMPVNHVAAGTWDDQPATATDAAGNYVVAWTNTTVLEDEEDETVAGFVTSIMARRYDNFGQAQGDSFMVASYISDTSPATDAHPDVALDADGNFVVVWCGPGIGDDVGIYGRLYSASGKAASTAFHVNQSTPNVQNVPSVAMVADGDFIVTWTSNGQSNGTDVFARRFNSQRASLGNEFLVNATTVGGQDKSDVAADANGGFVIVWESEGQDGSSWGVYGQRYSAAGTKLSGEFRVNTYTLDKQIDPAVAVGAGGEFVVTWSSMGQDGSGYGVYARRYNAAGAARDAAEFRVNQMTLNYQVTPDVGIAADGQSAITWSSLQDTDPNTGTLKYGIYARIFNADGSDYKDPKTGTTVGEFRVNAGLYSISGAVSILMGVQYTPAIAVNPTGDFVVAWAGTTFLSEVDEEGVVQPPVDGMAIFSRLIDTPANTGPTVSQIVVVEAAEGTRNGTLTASESLIISWNAADGDGVASTSLRVDGAAIAAINGPYTAVSGGVNYSALIGARSAGDHNYVITATDGAGNTTQYSGTFTVATSGSTSGATGDTGDTGPTISKIAVVEATEGTRDGVLTASESLIISWNAADPDGVASTSLRIDGATVAAINGPYAAASGGVNYSAMIGARSTGDHNYVITATDKAGNATQYSGAFTVVASGSTGGDTGDTGDTGPTISQIVVVEANEAVRDGVLTASESLIISWNAADPDGVASTSLRVDGAAVAAINGPYAAASGGVNYSALIGARSAGDHTYLVTATDKLGNATQYSGAFTVVASGSTGGDTSDTGPTISQIVVVEATEAVRDGVLTASESLVISWNAADGDGVASTSLRIDGAAVAAINGPYAAASGGVNYSALIGARSAGDHNYLVTATDKLGNAMQYSGAFTVFDAAAMNAVFSGLGNAVGSSPKVDWLL